MEIRPIHNKYAPVALLPDTDDPTTDASFLEDDIDHDIPPLAPVRPSPEATSAWESVSMQEKPALRFDTADEDSGSFPALKPLAPPLPQGNEPVSAPSFNTPVAEPAHRPVPESNPAPVARPSEEVSTSSSTRVPVKKSSFDVDNLKEIGTSPYFLASVALLVLGVVLTGLSWGWVYAGAIAVVSLGLLAGYIPLYMSSNS